jgi:hypothetical protein
VSEPLVVTIPHKLGRDEAVRRLKNGLSRRLNVGGLLAVDQANWTGDRVAFSLRALGQSSSGTIEVFDDHLRVEVVLPWLLAKVAERFVPQIRKEATLLIEKK